MFTRRIGLLAAIVSLLLVMSPSAHHPPAVSAAALDDDFNDNVTAAKWSKIVRGTGTSITEVNQRVEITLAASAANDPATGDFSAYYQSTCKLGGDFDIQVDYELLTWPSTSGVRVGLTLDGYSVQRGGGHTPDAFGEVYATDFNHVVTVTSPTAHTSGKLRLTRFAGVLRGYYDNGGWIEIANATFSAPTRYHLAAWSHDLQFNNQLTKVAFDNFIMNSGEASCFVGGVAELPDETAAEAAVKPESGSDNKAIVFGGGAAVLAALGTGWWLRRRRA